MLVVIGIILLLSAISLPAMRGFMKQQRLKSAAQLIQSMCMSARFKAIAEREPQYVLFFVNYNKLKINGDAALEKTEAVRSLCFYDSNISGTTNQYILVERQELPELLFIEKVAETNVNNTNPAAGDSKNFQLRFNADGTISFGNDQDSDASPARWDLVIAEKNSNQKCCLDFIPNTGRVAFKITE